MSSNLVLKIQKFLVMGSILDTLNPLCLYVLQFQTLAVKAFAMLIFLQSLYVLNWPCAYKNEYNTIIMLGLTHKNLEVISIEEFLRVTSNL